MKSFDQSTLLELAGERSFERGREYFLRGQALGFADHGDRAEGLVLGTRAYRTELRCEADRVLSSCDCPVGEAGGFCKHAVALGLRWLSGEDEEKSVAACERLIEYAVSSLRQGFFTDWRRLGGPALSEMLQSRGAKESLELIEGAMSKVAEAWSLQIEEGEGDCEWERMEEMLCEGHVVVAGDALRDVKSCARRVLSWQLKQAGAGFDAGRLSEKLCGGHGERWGADWRAAYQRLIKECWKKLSQIDDERLSLARRRQLAWLAQRLDGGNGQIADRVVAGCAEESVEQVWREFTASPTHSRFKRLKEWARSTDQWPEWRERVFEYLRQRLAESAKPPTGKKRSGAGIGKREDNSESVRIWLEEGEVEAALSAAKAGDCANDLWLKLAALRIGADPAEALAIYQRLIRKSLNRKDRYSAEQARKLLRKTRRLMKRLGRKEEYKEFIEELSRAFGSQRHFASVIANHTF